MPPCTHRLRQAFRVTKNSISGLPFDTDFAPGIHIVIQATIISAKSYVFASEMVIPNFISEKKLALKTIFRLDLPNKRFETLSASKLGFIEKKDITDLMVFVNVLREKPLNFIN